MNKERFVSRLLFSILVTLSTTALDLMFHLFQNATVQLSNVFVRMLFVFVVVFVVSFFFGISRKEGIIASVLAPVLLFIYYKLTSVTLQPDSQPWYMIHGAIFLGFSYWLIRCALREKHHSQTVRDFSRGLVLTLSTVAFDLLYIIFSGKMPNPMYTLTIFLIFLILFSVLFGMLQSGRWLIMSLAAGIIVTFFYGEEKTLWHGLFLLIAVGVGYFIEKKVMGEKL